MAFSGKKRAKLDKQQTIIGKVQHILCFHKETSTFPPNKNKILLHSNVNSLDPSPYYKEACFATRYKGRRVFFSIFSGFLFVFCDCIKALFLFLTAFVSIGHMILGRRLI